MPTTRVRKNVPLDHGDLEDLAAVRLQGSAEAVALHSLTGITLGERPSEAEALHALVVVGRQALARRKEEIGYERLASFQATDPETQAWQASRRARHARRHVTQ